MCELFSNLTQSDKNKKSKYYHKVFLCNCTIFDAISEMTKCFLPFVLPNFTQTHVAGWKVWWAASTFLPELNFAINVTKIWRLGLMPLFRWAENFWLTWLRIISNSSVLATNVMRRLLNVCSVEWVLLLCLFVFKIDYCGRRDLEVVYYGALQCPLSISYGSSVWCYATTTLPHIWCSPDLTYRHSGSFRRSMSYAMHAAWQSDISYLGRKPLSWEESRIIFQMIICLILREFHKTFLNFSLVFLFCDNRLVTTII